MAEAGLQLRQRLDDIADRINAVCDFTKSVSFRLLEAASWFVLLYIVGRAIWSGL
jgi:hypothetical protein